MLMGYTEGKYKTGWWSSGHRTTNHDTLVCEKTAESGPACATSVYFPKAGCKILPDVSLKLFKDRIPEGSSQELGSMKEDTGQQANNWPLIPLSTFLPSEPPWSQCHGYRAAHSSSNTKAHIARFRSSFLKADLSHKICVFVLFMNLL